MNVKLYRVIVPVKDIELAATFYSQLLGMSGMRVSPGRHYFDCGGTILACFDPTADGDGYEATPNPDHIYLSVDNLELAFEQAKQAGCSWIETAIETRPWGERCFYAKDPDGNPLCIVDSATLFTG